MIFSVKEKEKENKKERERELAIYNAISRVGQKKI
jgi:hypothetical protein